MTAELRGTPLHGEHVDLGAKLAPFAGFEMPVQYAAGIRAEHRAVREAAGLFDVSHMGEIELRGDGALDLVQYLTVNDATRLEVGQAQYSAFCREDGGVLDDVVVLRLDADAYLVVANAANRKKDLDWIRDHAEGFRGVADRSDEFALLALQGPRAEAVLRPLTDVDLDDLGYYRCARGSVCGRGTIVSRTGYTGEDGFELYLDAGEAVGVWRALLDEGEDEGLLPAGLGARDSLRLEMGYALYGNDLDEDHTPFESGLGWLTRLDAGPFVGRDALLRQREQGVDERLVGLRLVQRGFPRSGYDVLDGGDVVGRVTSGTVSPTLGDGIALAYVPADRSEPDTALAVDVRGREVAARVERTPFYTDGSLRR